MTQPERPTVTLARWYDAGSWLTRRALTKFAKAVVMAVAFAIPAAASAHSFSLAVMASGGNAATQLDSAVKGILLATRERDGHANETSDGHLGGLDVFIVPLSSFATETVKGLKRVSQTSINIAVLLVPETDIDQEMALLDPQTVIISPGIINTNQSEASTMFATRFQTAYGTIPDQWAAEGYNAARRIDLAVRPLGGVDDREALIAALAATEEGIKW